MNRGLSRFRLAAPATALLVAGCHSTHAPSVRELPDPILDTRGARPFEPGLPRIEPRPEIPAARADADWMPPGGISGRWRCIVIHHSAKDVDTPQGMADWHVNGRGWDELGYHFVIGNGMRFPDGQVFVGSRWPKQKHGAHCKVPGNYYNEHGIGICLIGNFNHRPPTSRQMESLNRLLSFLCRHTGITPDRVYTHGGVTRKTECPGRYFSIREVRSRLERSAAQAFAD